MDSETEAIENLGVEEILNVLLTRYTKLETRIKRLEEDLSNQKYEQAIDRQKIADLKLANSAKEGSQRDFDLLTVDLLKAVSTRERGMDYRDVRNHFGFKSDVEAYRIMDRTVKKFPLDVKMKEVTYGKRTKKVLFYTHEIYSKKECNTNDESGFSSFNSSIGNCILSSCMVYRYNEQFKTIRSKG